jgi:2-polyprenyl-6-methoxyphenol hydroxylase-like FAD-dependent oxidoreductase
MRNKGKVLIVGAGPGGMATALFLAKKGISSTILEKRKFPRDKICGDALTAWALTMLDKLDPNLSKKLRLETGVLESWGMKVFAPNMKNLILPGKNKSHPEHSASLVIKRIDFDNFLYREIKLNPLIEIIEETEITHYETKEGGILIRDDSGERSFEADLLVLADGANSKFTRSSREGEIKGKNHATGIRAYYQGTGRKAQGSRLRAQVKNQGSSCQ